VLFDGLRDRVSLVVVCRRVAGCRSRCGAVLGGGDSGFADGGGDIGGSAWQYRPPNGPNALVIDQYQASGYRHSAAVREVLGGVHSGESPAHAAGSRACRSTRRRWLQQAGFVPRTPVPVMLSRSVIPEWPMSLSNDADSKISWNRGYIQPGRRLARGHRHTMTARWTVDQTVRIPGTGGSRHREANPQASKPRHLEDRSALLADGVARLEQRHSPGADRAPAAPGFPRRSGDVGVTRDDLPGPLRPTPRGARRLVKTALRTAVLSENRRAARQPESRPNSKT